MSPGSDGGAVGLQSEPVPTGVVKDALLFATVPALEGGPAAALPVLGQSVLGRLLGQLGSLGVERIWVVTRAHWKQAVESAAARGGAELTVVAAHDVGEDLERTAEIASAIQGPLIVGSAHVITDREALVDLADPRVASGVLITRSPDRSAWSFPIRSLRGRVTSAASPYHHVRMPTGYFLGVMKLGPGDSDRLVAAAGRLAELATDSRPIEWEREFDRKLEECRLAPESAENPILEVRRRALREDAVPLLLVGLVRSGVELVPADLREFFYATPFSSAAAGLAAEELSGHDEDKALLDSAVKTYDGFFTTFFVSPYSKHLARFAARRGWSPNAVTTLSFAIGVAAAASFAAGTRLALIGGAVLLQASFTVDCVDGQLARYTRRSSNFGSWLDSILDRAKEFLIYGGLAIGATRGPGGDVWILATAAVALQTIRHLSDVSYHATQRAEIVSAPRLPLELSHGDAAKPPTPPNGAPGRQGFELHRSTGWGWVRWSHRILRFPIGERFAVISATAAIADPRVTFVVLLAWGAAAAVYAITGRILMAYSVPERIFDAIGR